MRIVGCGYWAVVAVLLGCGADPAAGEEPTTTVTGSPASGTSTGAPGTPVQCEGSPYQGGEDGAEDTGFGMGDDMPLPLSIYDVQQGDAPDGALVRLVDVVVTTPPASTELEAGNELFVQEREGGPYSGIRIHAIGFDIGPVLSVGNTTELVGRVESYDSWVVLRVASADDVAVTGTAPLPEPVVVAAADLHRDDPDARAYEGVVVRVEMATVTDDDPCDGEFVLDEVTRVDDRFVPGALATPGVGEVVPAVEGVLSFTSDGYELAPPDPSSVE